jgi:hypothetical protein
LHGKIPDPDPAKRSGSDTLHVTAYERPVVSARAGQVGGKKAGLLNFSSSDCPYQAKEVWQYGTKVTAPPPPPLENAQGFALYCNHCERLAKTIPCKNYGTGKKKQSAKSTNSTYYFATQP